MSDAARDELIALFGRASALPAAERADFLAELACKDPAAARELEELLAQDERGGPVPSRASLKRSLVQALVDELAGEGASDAPSSVVLEKLAARTPAAPRYSIQGELARGGMGAIFAVWDEDIGRNLAMKVALGAARGAPGGSPAKLDARTLARFLEEAQVTGQLDHPGIVPVHELGLDHEGRVYFTMRLVKGRDLEAIFALVQSGAEGWTQTRALGVLLKACEALSYAHASGVVHRDLKPANVMIGGFGEVYVMDWGLARARGRRGTDDIGPAGANGGELQPGQAGLLATEAGTIMGTPAYMPPEQAAGRLEEVDERSDVYAVGAMLYQLLVRRRPYCGPDEQPAAFAVITRVLAGPPEPIHALAPDAPAELVAICEKAMARAPLGRYRDVGELGEDLRAYLEGRVVRAFETGAWAEARKWVQRNRGFAGAIAAGLLVLVAGLTASLILKSRSDHNAAEASKQRGRAEESASLAEERRVEAERNAVLADERRRQAELNEAEARRQQAAWESTSDFLFDIFVAASPEEAMGRDVTARDLLDRGRAKVEQQELEPIVKAQLLFAIGHSYDKLGIFPDAVPLLSESFELMRSLRGEDDLNTLRTGHELGCSLLDAGHLDEADPILSANAERYRRTLGEDHRETLQALVALARLESERGDLQEAKALLEDLLPRVRKVMGNDDQGTAVTLGNLAGIYESLGRMEAAEPLDREACEILRKTLGPDHPKTLIEVHNFATLLNSLSKLDEAAELDLDCLERTKIVFGADHPQVLYVLNNLGCVYDRQGRSDEAIATLSECEKGCERFLPPDHPLRFSVLRNLGAVLARHGRLDAVERLFLDALESLRTSLPASHPTRLWALVSLGALYVRQERFAEAEPLVREVCELRRASLGASDPETLQAMCSLGEVHIGLGRLTEAEEVYSEAYELSRDALGENAASTRMAAAALEKLHPPAGPH